MLSKSSLVAVTLAVLSLTSTFSPVGAGATEPPAGGQIASLQAGTVVVYLSHGRWLWWDYGTHERAVQALNEYRSAGIPAYIR